MKLNEKLLSLRKAKGLTQMKLAEMTNVSRQAVSRWESGVAVPSTDNLEFLGRLYDVPLEYLLHDDAPAPMPQESEKNIEKSGTGKRGKKWKLISVAIAIIAAVILFLCIAFSVDDSTSPVPLDELDRREVEIDNMEDFELDF